MPSGRRNRGLYIRATLAAAVVVAALSIPKALSPVSAGETEDDQLPPGTLGEIQHRSVGIRPQEAGAYYQVLFHAARLDYSRQKRMAREFLERRSHQVMQNRDKSKPFPVFVDLFQHPEAYHGKLVTLRGDARKIVPSKAGPNPFGLEQLYEIWLYTDDSQSNPAVVITTSIPEGMPIGDNIMQRVEATGFFFKLYGYHARDVLRVAPMVLGNRLEWLPGSQPGRMNNVTVVMAICLAVGVLILAVWGLRTYRRDRAFRAALRARTLASTAPDFSAIAAAAKSAGVQERSSMSGTGSDGTSPSHSEEK